MELVVTAVVLAVFAVLFVASRNATTICVLAIDAGTVTIKRGSLAHAILSDVADVVRRPKVTHATVRISRRSGYADVDVKGDVSEAQRQQLRNIIGRVPLAKLVRSRGRKP